ncbi:alpha-glucosidase [Azospirillum sp. RWY-5-1]|uniref:Alpha-glucosidase n=1 Tax=Azospirillum oleiclasticum TaxID=2735135 RepID=A0ABX2TIH7_9PROT|nr:TIM-barrel domain-containing protein [Azospirillum oleiclasticum]NYZ16107.1 alpha-glucosidase [Azospirillum oleiclasticum]NYZ22988.1 alpha-glucosidase [Azospirillum oleiclasticum]
MRPLTGARLLTDGPEGIVLALDHGYRLTLFPLGPALARVLIERPEGLRSPRTWSLSPELSGQSDPALADPIDGRDRRDLTGFAPVDAAVAEDEAAVTVTTERWRVTVRRAPLALTWEERDGDGWRTVLADRPTQPYLFDGRSPRFAHHLVAHAGERYHGFGDKSGGTDKRGRRLAMGTTDALGYDAETSDPLYKHIPFCLSVRPDRGGSAVGLFHDNLSRGVWDLGQTIDAYHGDFIRFEATDGDLDYYVVFGPSVAEVVAGFTALTGRTSFRPRWALSYSGSTMQYTDAPDADRRLLGFLDELERHVLPCGSFQMSSGYTMIGDKRYVFHWNRDKFPDPDAVAKRFVDAGVQLVANIKPALLDDHPKFGEVLAFGGFVRDGDDPTRPHVTQFWGGDGAYLDFTNPATSRWWSENVTRELLERGIGSTWNDNNEYEIWDDAAPCDVAGRGGTMATLRPVQTHLMIRASYLAQIAHAPERRPYLISRSGGPGLQRYVQTWSGDNRTDWKTLRWNLRMGHGFSLTGLFDFGHDVGGFAGPRPEPELLLRWIEQAVWWPRFTIHSWNDDGSVTEPWTFPEILPQVRAAFQLRERLVPLFYTLLWRAHREHTPVLRPLFFDFPDQPEAYGEEDSVMVGDRILVAPVLDPGVEERALWLPAVPGGWYDLRDGKRYEGGVRVTVAAPLGVAPAFVRAGTLLPLGPSPSWGEGPLTVRVFPGPDGFATLTLFDDDGVSVCRDDNGCVLTITGDDPAALTVARSGGRAPRWTSLVIEDAAGRRIGERPLDRG